MYRRDGIGKQLRYANLNCQLLNTFVVMKRQARLDANAIRRLNVIRKAKMRQIKLSAARRANMTHCESIWKVDSERVGSNNRVR
jgi:hypothetical protein